MSNITSQIAYLRSLMTSGQLSCEELTRTYLEAIHRDNGAINAYIRITEDAALSAARRVDEKLRRGQTLHPLEGIPMTIKDNISTDGIETSCCSRILQGYVPIYDATVWHTLKQHNAVLLGKANMDEFAMGSSCETSCYGPTLNPHSRHHVSGGSSGGSAAAVAAHLAAYSLGTDTGGSIRQPASFCGLVGFKPTYGAVSRYGLIAYGSSLDQIGPLTSCVEDAALVYDAISAYDSQDTTSQGSREPALPTLKADMKGRKIGVAQEYFEGIQPDVRTALDAAIRMYESLGAEIVSIEMPVLRYAVPVYYILSCAEASSNLSRFDGIRYGYQTANYQSIDEMICKTRSEGFGAEVKRRILLGNYVLSSGYYDAYYKKAQKLRGSVVRAFEKAFGLCDVILCPTVPMTAFERNFAARDQVEAYMTDICTVPVNIAGLPGISVPCGVDSAGLPIGMQLIANRFCEKTLLNTAWHYEQAADDTAMPTVDMGVKL